MRSSRREGGDPGSTRRPPRSPRRREQVCRRPRSRRRRSRHTRSGLRSGTPSGTRAHRARREWHPGGRRRPLPQRPRGRRTPAATRRARWHRRSRPRARCRCRGRGGCGPDSSRGRTAAEGRTRSSFPTSSRSRRMWGETATRHATAVSSEARYRLGGPGAILSVKWVASSLQGGTMAERWRKEVEQRRGGDLRDGTT